MDTTELYDEIIKHCPRFDRKGKSMRYTSANGHMFSFVNKAGELGCRFSKEVQESYLKEFDTTLFHSHGAVMKGYILIPETMHSDIGAIAKLFNESYDYVMTLKAK